LLTAAAVTHPCCINSDLNGFETALREIENAPPPWINGIIYACRYDVTTAAWYMPRADF
jgi:hypothetical protein